MTDSAAAEDATAQILRTMYRYNRALDYGREDEWLDVFTPDASYDTILPDRTHFVQLSGHGELRAFIQGYPHPPDSYQKHILLSPIIEVDGEEASADSGFLFLTRGPDGAPRVGAFGRYRDRFRRTGGVWRFSERICDTEAVAAE